MGESLDFAQEFYRQMREAITGRVSRDAKRREERAKTKASKPFESGRDPVSVAATIDDLVKNFNWETQLGEADLFASWARIVGDTNAASSSPETLTNRQLVIRCKSTAWAAQLRLMESQILEKIRAEFPLLEIETIRFLGPTAPSWKKGLRSVPGRGPRDTYG